MLFFYRQIQPLNDIMLIRSFILQLEQLFKEEIKAMKINYICAKNYCTCDDHTGRWDGCGIK